MYKSQKPPAEFNKLIISFKISYKAWGYIKKAHVIPAY